MACWSGWSNCPSRCSRWMRRIASASGAITSARNTATLSVLSERFPRTPRVALTATADAADGGGYPRGSWGCRMIRCSGPGLRPPEHPDRGRRRARTGTRADPCAFLREASHEGRRPASSIAAPATRPSRRRRMAARAMGMDAAGLPCRHGRARTKRDAASPLRPRRQRGDVRHHRLRHGHRPAGCALGGPSLDLPKGPEGWYQEIGRARPRWPAGPRAAAVWRRRYRARAAPDRVESPALAGAEAHRAHAARRHGGHRRGRHLPPSQMLLRCFGEDLDIRIAALRRLRRRRPS
jgi:ATP-dependent DNA helicase RecQ